MAALPRAPAGVLDAFAKGPLRDSDSFQFARNCGSIGVRSSWSAARRKRGPGRLVAGSGVWFPICRPCRHCTGGVVEISGIKLNHELNERSKGAQLGLRGRIQRRLCGHFIAPVIRPLRRRLLLGARDLAQADCAIAGAARLIRSSHCYAHRRR